MIYPAGRSVLDVPPGAQERLTRAFGRNPFDEPNYRIRWGWTTLEWVCGRTRVEDAHGNFLREEFELHREPRSMHECIEGVCFQNDEPDYEPDSRGVLVPVYPVRKLWELGPSHQFERWQVDQWMPPEYWAEDAETWHYRFDEQEGMSFLPTMGPFPRRGDYRQLFEIEFWGTHEFCPLTPKVLDAIVARIRHDRAAHHDELAKTIKRGWERQKAAMRRADDEAISEALDIRIEPHVGYTKPTVNMSAFEKLFQPMA